MTPSFSLTILADIIRVGRESANEAVVVFPTDIFVSSYE